MMMMSENQSSQSQVHVTAFRGLRVKRKKASLNRRPTAHTAAGARFSSNTSHMTRKPRTVNATLAMGHQADLAHC
jgi:hypothetical protein